MLYDVVIVGGGAAGMAAALFACSRGASVLIIEKNEKLGIKLSITGKGRCNLTNNCGVETVLNNITRNSKFMYSALRSFQPQDVMRFFEDLGVRLKTERGNRVFPVSDKASEVVSALRDKLYKTGAEILTARAEKLLIENGSIAGVRTSKGDIHSRAAVVAAGGLSYPKTGSSGDGFKLAKAAGHTVTELYPSLVPLVSDDRFCAQMHCLSLKNVKVRVKSSSGKTIYEDFGEMQFTHYGVSGPVVLSASAHMHREKQERCNMYIDLKPAIDEKTLYMRITKDFEKYSNRDFKNALQELAPRLMIPVLVELSQIPPETKTHSVTKAQKNELVKLFKNFPVAITGTRPIEEAVITSGGVNVKEINPGTMESKLVKGLFFAGEVIDVDAYTGGFNLQIAWSTARLAGLNAGRV